MSTRHARYLLALILVVAGITFAGAGSALALYVGDGIYLSNDSAPQNYADIDGTIAVWRDGRAGTCGAWDIWMYDFATGVSQPVTTADKKQEYPRIDGRYIVYQSDEDCDYEYNDSNIYVYDLIAQEAEVIAMRVTDQERPDVSGGVVVWEEYVQGGYDIDWTLHAYDMSSQAEKVICDAGDWRGNVRISGDIVVWEDARDGDSDVYMYDLSTDVESEVCTATDSQWSPVVEGDTIAWIDGRDGYDAVYTYSILGGTEAEVCTSTGNIDELEIGDGVLVWSDDVTGNDEIYAFDLGTSELTQLTDFPGCDGMPAISGDLVVFNHRELSADYPDIMAMCLADGDEIPADVVPLSGQTRFDTAVEVSREAYPGGADSVVIATGSNWPDALGASALAGAHGAPILLTASGYLPASVATEIERLGATDVFVIGGAMAVSDAVVAELSGLVSGDVVRLGGSTRYETAQIVASETVAANPDWDGTAFVTTGQNFPDALSASPLAAYAGWPIFLSGPDGISAATQAVMDDMGVSRLLLLGGAGVVPASVSVQANEMGVAAVERISGMNRYGTAVAIATWGAENLGMGWGTLALATGDDFPDALSAGVAQGRTGNLLLLTPPDQLDGTTATAIAAHRFQLWCVRYVGGMNAISAEVRAEVEAMLP